MTNSGFFDPEGHMLLISARAEDVYISDEEPGRVVIAVKNFDEGVEVYWPHDRLWYPADDAPSGASSR